MRALATRAVAALLVAAAGVAAPAAACTVMFMEPAIQRQLDLQHQRRLRAHADAVFLARARPKVSQGGTMLDAIVRVDGRKPPSRVFLPADTSDCMPSSPPRGVRIVFARQIRIADAGWKVWKWGQWVVADQIAPSQVVDPALARALQRAAGRPETHG